MRKYNFNERAFATWNQDMAYWLGMIAADGCVSLGDAATGYPTHYALILQLKWSDHEEVRNLARFLQTTAPVNRVPHYECSYPNGQDGARLVVHSKAMIQDLISLGLEPRKSFTMEWQNSYPLEYIPHYVRGFFDGDGAIFRIKHPSARRDYIGINFTGPKQYLEGLRDVINRHVIGKDYGYLRELIIKNGFYYQLVYSGDETIQKICEWMYQNSTEQTRLARKWQFAQNYFNELKSLEIPVTPQRENFLHTPKEVDKWVVTVEGEETTLTEAAKRSDAVVSRQALYYRIIKKGMTPEAALTTPTDQLPKAEAPNIENGKIANHAIINWSIAACMRAQYLTGDTVAAVAATFGQSDALVGDVVRNRSWFDPQYQPPRRKGEEIALTYDDRTGTLTEWSDWTGIPKNTIDRRLREKRPVAEVLKVGRVKSKPYKQKEVGSTGMTAAKATSIRQDYKDGIRGEASWKVKWKIKESQYTDIILNRTWKEEVDWWHEDDSE